MLGDRDLQEVIETLYEEMGTFLAIVEAREINPDAPGTNRLLDIASTINSSLMRTIGDLPGWIKLILESLNELIEITKPDSK